MKDYDVDNKCVKLLKEAIDVFADGETFHDNLSRSAHMLGLQGFKRWHRVQSKDDRSKRIKIQHHAIDMFGVNLEPRWSLEVVEPLDYLEHLDVYLEWEIGVYKHINTISNKLVVEGFGVESCLVAECLSEVSKEIEKIRRWTQDYEFTNKDNAYLKLVDKVLHDKVKAIEE